MQNIAFSIGDTIIGGVFSGQSHEENGILNIKVDLEFYLKDEDVEVDDYRPSSI